MTPAVVTTVTSTVAAFPRSPTASTAAPMAKSSVVDVGDNNSTKITIASTAVKSEDDSDIEFLANALKSHLSFNLTMTDSPSLSSDSQSSSTSSSSPSVNTISPSKPSSISKLPVYLRHNSLPSPNTKPFSIAGTVKKTRVPGLTRRVSLAEVQKEQEFLEFRTWSDESSDPDDEDDDDEEDDADEDEGKADDGEAAYGNGPNRAPCQSTVLPRRLKKRTKRERAPRPVLASSNGFSPAKSMITIMSASTDDTESWNSERTRLLAKIETLTRERDEARTMYLELKGRYVNLSTRFDQGIRENELLQSRISGYESSDAPPVSPDRSPGASISNSVISDAPSAGPPKLNHGVGLSSGPTSASSSAVPASLAPANAKAVLAARNVPNTIPADPKVIELCGARAYSRDKLRKRLSMTSANGAVNVPNMLGKTLERPKYRFEPNSVTILLCSKNHDGPTIRSDIFSIFRDKASSSPVTKVSRDTRMSTKPMCIINCVNDRAAAAAFEALSVHPTYQNFILILS
ncbi:hypothetical protein POJ06DRAFT_142478 [Lipomyces tetrasporus]|uniref:Uncharacterized protein n=1 Tax=Lipomyces tetrasporus TaxID=54092 RepID=A0AAD7QPG5_9ASCO|nr:uncharacterized protein POJ06DRAFT_142478 [Lipomyces tetrasporus]KAJ8098805.1 hypothetical protein POJ06DRAFT_142478 [Lipomyces tetrasporus]